MLNVHLNGDVVRCPDYTEIRIKAQEIRDKHRICKFNFHEDNCDVWQSQFKIGRCTLGMNELCPCRKRQIEHGKKEKTFNIDNKIYRKLASSANFMFKERKPKQNTLWFTLTFPEFFCKPKNECKNEFCKIAFEKTLNQCFHKFADNLHNNYGVTNYVAVKEYGGFFGRVHYHCLFNMHFTNFIDLNNAWCAAISNICYYSKNAFTSDSRTVVLYSPAQAIRYACKYFSKQRGKKHKTRIVFISNNLLSHEENGKRVSNIKKTISARISDILKNYESVTFCQTSDFTTRFRITDFKEFNHFCKKFLYSLFELSDNSIEFTAGLDYLTG